MLLTVDVGNTSTAMGLWRERELLARWRIATDRGRMAEEYAVFLDQVFRLKGLPRPAAAAVASVVPPVEHELEAAFRELWGIETHHLTPANAGLSIEVDHPQGVGPDRLANALAVLEHGDSARYLVVDFGTATTFDLVEPPNRYLGGAIAPGPETAAEALAERTAMLPRFDLVPPPRGVVGKNTTEALQSGLVLGYAALVDGMVERFAREVGPVKVVATGGFARVLAGLSARLSNVDPDLTLKGVRRFFETARG